jgi:hypothetical protein
MRRPFISEGGGEAAMLADHSRPEDTGVDTPYLKIIPLKIEN